MNTINRAGAAAIGLNILMPEADALSPERLLVGSRSVQDRSVVAALRSLLVERCGAGRRARLGADACWPSPARPMPPARRCARRPITVQATGTARDADRAGRRPLCRGADQHRRAEQPGQRLGPDLGRHHARHRPPHSARRQHPGHAGADPGRRDAPRRLPRARHPADRGRRVGDQPERGRRRACSTEKDGAVRVYYSRHRADRFVSAIDVLEDRVDPALLHKQMVLIGPTAIGLQVLQDTPIGERMSGSEIQAQLLENLLDGTLLQRPLWAPAAEALLVLVCGGLLVWAMRRLHPLSAALLMLILVALSALGAFGLYPRRAPAARCGDAEPLPAADLRRAARALAGRGDSPAQVARERRAGPARADARASPASSRRRSASRPRACRARPAARRRARRSLRRVDAGARSRRRPVRLLHARRRPAVPADRRRRRQGALGLDLHGRQQGAVQGPDDPHARARHRRHHDRGQRRGVARQRRDALRHRLRRHPRPAQRRARLLQRRPREPVPAPARQRAARTHRRRRRPAAVRDERLRLPQRLPPARAGRAAVPHDRRRHRSAGRCRRAVRPRAGPSRSSASASAALPAPASW